MKKTAKSKSKSKQKNSKSLKRNSSLIKKSKKALSTNKQQKSTKVKVKPSKSKQISTQDTKISQLKDIYNNTTQKTFYQSLPLKKGTQKNKKVIQKFNKTSSELIQNPKSKSKLQTNSKNSKQSYLSMSSDSSQNGFIAQQQQIFVQSLISQDQVRSDVLNYGELNNIENYTKIESLTDIMDRQDKLQQQNLIIELKKGWTKHKNFGISAIRFFNAKCENIKYKTIYYQNGQIVEKYIGLDQQINNQMQQFVFDYLEENVLEFQFQNDEVVSAFAIWNYYTSPEYGIKQVVINYQNQQQLLQILQNNQQRYVVNFSLVNLQSNLSLKKLKHHILKNLLWKEIPTLPIKNTCDVSKNNRVSQLDGKYKSLKFKQNIQRKDSIRSKSNEKSLVVKQSLKSQEKKDDNKIKDNQNKQICKKSKTSQIQLIKVNKFFCEKFKKQNKKFYNSNE